MQCFDISHDSQTMYSLKKGEQKFFFLLNRSGEITFELLEPEAQVFVLAVFIGKAKEAYRLTLNQRHGAHTTSSRVIVKSVLNDHASMSYHGTIEIGSQALRSEAYQESRSLLLSPQSTAETQPNLEIHTNDVKCYHAATVSSIDSEKMFYLASRNLGSEDARKVLITGFLNEAFDTPLLQTIDTTSIQEEISQSLAQTYDSPKRN